MSSFEEIRVGLDILKLGECDVYLEAIKEDFILREGKKKNEIIRQASIRFCQDFRRDADLFQQCQAFLYINNQLRIHPRAFVQLKDDEKAEILKATEELDKGKDLLGEGYNYFFSILKNYRINMDCFLPKQLCFIAQTLGVGNLDAFCINGCAKKSVACTSKCAILSNIKPFQIVKLFNFLKYDCDTESKLKIAKEFAEYVKATNLSDFCGAAEFAVVSLKNKRKEEQETKNAKTSKEIQEIEKSIVDNLEHTLKEIKTSLNKLIDAYEECIREDQNSDLKFSSSWTAVTHFLKHGNEIVEDIEPSLKRICISGIENSAGTTNENFTNHPIKKYLRLARDNANKNVPQTFWSQDGKLLIKYYSLKIDDKNCLLVLSENVFTNQQKIVTFYKDNTVREDIEKSDTIDVRKRHK